MVKIYKKMHKLILAVSLGIYPKYLDTSTFNHIFS